MGETTASQMSTMGSTRLMTAAMIRCHQLGKVAMVETIAALSTTDAVRTKVTATLIPTVWEISAVDSTTVSELGLMPPMIVARNQIQSKIVTEETLAAQLTTPATRASETVTLTSNVLRGSNAGLTTATRTTQCLMAPMTAVKDPAQNVMEAILVVLRPTNAMRAKETVTMTLIVRATLFVSSTIVIKKTLI